MNPRFLAMLAALAFVGAGCSTVEDPPAPSPTPTGHPDEAAPIMGGALFNGN